MMKWTRARPPSGKAGIVGGKPAFEDGLEIGADLLAHDGIVAVARHEDDDGDEAVELVDAVERPDARPLDEAEDRLGMLAQGRHGDLEQLVARIAFEHVDQRLAGMVVGIEAGFLDDGLGLRAQIGDLHHRARVGGRGEQADDPEFAGQLAFLVEGLDADIVEIGAAVHDRLGVRLGHDQRIRAVEEGADLGRGGLALGAAQHPHIGIGEDAEAGTRGAGQRAALLAAGIAELAHAEEGEIVVAQPFRGRRSPRRQRPWRAGSAGSGTPRSRGRAGQASASSRRRRRAPASAPCRAAPSGRAPRRPKAH